MFGILVVSHDDIAGQLVKAAQNIVGHTLENVVPVSIGWEQDIDNAREKIEKALKKVSEGDGAIILTDMFGGTPTNVSLTFLEKDYIEVVTGANLPMMIKLASLQKDGKEVSEAARLARDRGRQTILVASEVLGGENNQKQESENDENG